MSSFDSGASGDAQDVSAGTFSCVLIPESDFQGLSTITLSMAGGLEKDELQVYAKAHLKRDSDSSARLESLQQQMREAGTDLSSLNPQMLASLSTMGTQLEITSLQMATPANGYIAVSLYSDGNALNKEFKSNTRATRLARACGHPDIVIHGDCLLGRSYDNEEVPWERRDISEAESKEDAAWVLAARKANSGKDLSKLTTAGALGASMTNVLGKNNTYSSTSNPFAALAPAAEVDSGDEAVSWTQSGSEIEVKIKVDASVIAKMVKIDIHPTYIRIRSPVLSISELSKSFCSESGLVLANRISVDESSWGIEGVGGNRCITLTLAGGKGVKWTSLCAK